MKAYFVSVFIAVLLSLPLTAAAQVQGQQQPLLPDDGTYWDRDQPGTGLTVDVDPNGYIFATLFVYDRAGNPVFYNMEGFFEPAADISEGAIGSFEAELYASHGGECLGSDCSYASPERSMTGMHAHITWTTARHASLSIGGAMWGDQTWDLRAGEYTVADKDLIAGTWSATFTLFPNAVPPVVDPPRPYAMSYLAILDIQPMIPDPWPDNPYREYDVKCALPNGRSDWLIESCDDLHQFLAVEPQGPVFGTPPAGFRYQTDYAILYDRGDGSMVLTPYNFSGGKPHFAPSSEEAGKFYQMVLEAGVMRGRSIEVSESGTHQSKRGSVIMVRVPEGTYVESADDNSWFTD